jgi:hypothetical protein
MERLMKTTEARVGKMETQLKRWGAKLDQLVARADTDGADAKIDQRKRIAELKTKHKLARAKLDELKAASGEGWETLKEGAESAWSDFEVAFKKFMN